MGRAVITLSDDPDGYIEMNVTFDGDYDKTSHAHGQAALLIAHIDDLAEQRKEVAAEVVG